MRCNKCNQNDATIFLTQIVDGNITKVALCAKCGAPFINPATSPSQFIANLRKAGYPVPSPGPDFAELAANHPRFAEPAFYFVRDGLDRATKAHSPPSHHVTAEELLDALRSLAWERYGRAARTQLASWGVTCCEDFGEIVFTLIEHHIFGKTAEDKKEDFSNGYDFVSAFPGAES